MSRDKTMFREIEIALPNGTTAQILGPNPRRKSFTISTDGELQVSFTVGTQSPLVAGRGPYNFNAITSGTTEGQWIHTFKDDDLGDAVGYPWFAIATTGPTIRILEVIYADPDMAAF